VLPSRACNVFRLLSLQIFAFHHEATRPCGLSSITSMPAGSEELQLACLTATHPPAANKPSLVQQLALARARREAAAKASQALESRLDALQSPQAQPELDATRAIAAELEKQVAEQAAVLRAQQCAHEAAAMEGQAAVLLEEYNNKVGPAAVGLRRALCNCCC
jgi:hypothetical protein